MTDTQDQNPLTDRQMEVLRLVAQGVTNKEIGQALDISEHTVRKHLQNIFEKLEVSSRTEATTVAYQRGWVTLPTPESGPPAAQNKPAMQTGGAGTPAAEVDMRWLIAVGITGVAVLLLIAVYAITRQSTSVAGSPVVSAVEIDRWTETTPLTVPRSGLAATGLKGQLYVVAGDSPDGLTGLTERFDPREEQWVSLKDKPTAVRDVGAAVVGGKIYVPGGCDADGAPIPNLEVYDPEADSWSARAALPQPLCGYAIAALEGKLYVFGGWDGKGYTRHVFIYDPDEDRWSKGTPMPTARGYAGAGAIEGQIYVVGGYDGRRDLAVVEAYVPANEAGSGDPWVEHAALPDGRGGAGVVALRSKLYIIGGGWETGHETAIMYDVLSDTWNPFANPVAGLWRNMGVAVIDTRSETRIYAVGGWDGDFVAANRAYTALYNVKLPLQQR